VAGHHRFLWDMHYTPLEVDASFPMSAVYQNTAPESTSPWVLPGEYTVRLTVDGQRQEQKLTVKMDPRVQSTPVQLQEQFDFSTVCYNARKKAVDALGKIAVIESQMLAIKVTGPLEKSLTDFKTKLGAMKGSAGYYRDTNAVSWNTVAGNSEHLFGILQGADMPVTTQTRQGVADLGMMLKKVSEAWATFLTVDMINLNKELKSSGIKSITL